MNACVGLVSTKFILTILLYYIQHVYYVYGIPYMQVAVIEQICPYNIYHYAVKALTAWFCMYQDALSMFHHYHCHSSMVHGSTLRDNTHTTFRLCVTLQLHRILCDCKCYTHGPE